MIGRLIAARRNAPAIPGVARASRSAARRAGPSASPAAKVAAPSTRSAPSGLNSAARIASIVAVEVAQHRHRAVAVAAERGEQRALGGHFGAARRVVDRREPVARRARRPRGIRSRSRPAPAPAAIRPGSSGWPVPVSPSRARPAAARKVASASPAASLASRVATLPRNGHDPAVGPRVERLRRAARRAGADHRALGQRGEARRAEQHVALVGARQDRGEREAVGPQRLDVLERMHRGVDPAFGQPLVELAGPQRLAADLGQRAVLHLVAAGEHRDQLDRVLVPAVRRAQPRARLFRLRHGQRRAAGAELEEWGAVAIGSRLP